jgi:hypothetical protein
MSALYGCIPESHNCLDCGYDTMPGTPNRAMSEQMIAEQKARGVEKWSLPCHLHHDSEQYMVHDHIWKKAGMKGWSDKGESGVLCIGCLEKRIGRKLEPFDFGDHCFNNPNLPGTRRRFERLTGGTTWEGLDDEPAPPPPSKLDQALHMALGGKQWRAA